MCKEVLLVKLPFKGTPSISNLATNDFSLPIVKTATSDLPPILNTGGVSNFLGMSEAQVREYHRQGKLRGFLAGRSLRFTRDAVEKFIADREAAV
jgi:hypothetical protein